MILMNVFRDWFFKKVQTNNLVYNTCWEDPRCDRQLLELDDRSEVVMITSAGCNALDYLLDNPRRIHSVDMNPRQNALLELKLAALEHCSYPDLFQLFGRGFHSDIDRLYKERLRPHLPEFAQTYWDKKRKFFNGKGVRKSFYHYSTSGTLAWIARQYLRLRKNIYRQVNQLFEAESLDRQAMLYYQIEPKLVSRATEWFLNRHFTLCLAGVPRSQQQLFVHQYERGAFGFIQECLRKVFAERPLQDNYFWQVYLRGAYAEDCCPSYLKAENFTTLSQQTGKIRTHTTTITQFLKENPGIYSHYVLLDHQDWLAANDRPALEEEWRQILQNSRSGSRILLRSAAEQIDFFPDFVKDTVIFEKEKTGQTHQQDRVGTYASVYLGIVK